MCPTVSTDPAPHGVGRALHAYLVVGVGRADTVVCPYSARDVVTQVLWNRKGLFLVVDLPDAQGIVTAVPASAVGRLGHHRQTLRN